MKNILEYIKGEVSKVCDISKDIPFVCEYTRNPSYGEFAINVAMVSSRLLKKSPMVIAEELLPLIQNIDFVKTSTIAKPGFINICIHESYFTTMLESLFFAKELPNYGNKERINVEYVSANPTGPLHVGHLRGAIYGDVLASLLSKVNFDVTKEYYINDAGNQIGILGKSVWIRYRQLLGDDAEVPEGCYPAEYIIDIAKEIIYKHGKSLQDDDKVFTDYAVEYNMKWIKSTLAKLKIQHNVFSSEKEIVNSNAIKEAFIDLEKKNLTYTGIPPKPHNASEEWKPTECLMFKSTAFGDNDDRVIQKNDGSYTYCVPDMVYNRNKFKRGFHKLIMVLGADHLGYVSRLKAMTQSISDDEINFDIKICQIVKFLQNGQTFKMSKRAGSFVTVDDILENVHTDILRFIMLTKKNDIHMDFDIEKVKEQTRDNPIFYIQYAYSRLSSILRKSTIKSVDFTNHHHNPHLHNLTMKLLEFPSILAVSVKKYEPHHLAFYASSLASTLHTAWTVGNSTLEAKFLIDGNNNHNQASINIVFAAIKVFDHIFDIFNIEPLTSM